MYRIKEIQNALLHLVGWEQALNPKNYISGSMTESETGLYFQGAHPLVTLENIRSVMPDEWPLQYPAWSNLLDYRAGDKVEYEGIIFIAIADSTNQEPTAEDFNGDYSNRDFGNSYWKPFNEFSDYLEKITRDGITKAIQTFIQAKGLANETRNLLENKNLFNGSGRYAEFERNSGRLVGFEIAPVRSRGVTVKINRIGLQMRGATGIVRVYLFHTSKVDPVKVYDLNFTNANGGFQWFNISDAFLANNGIDHNSVGSWYVMYDQNYLPAGMEAINFTKDWSVEPCGTCGVDDLHAWRELMRYARVTPFRSYAPETFKQFPELSDLVKPMYTTTVNYGMNLDLSIGCDLTDFIISQRDIFQVVIQKQVAAIALRTMAMNPDVRVNRNQSNASSMDILYELDGNQQGPRPNGLGYELKKAFDALNFDTKGIDKICLGCGNSGMRFKTIG